MGWNCHIYNSLPHSYTTTPKKNRLTSCKHCCSVACLPACIGDWHWISIIPTQVLTCRGCTLWHICSIFQRDLHCKVGKLWDPQHLHGFIQVMVAPSLIKHVLQERITRMGKLSQSVGEIPCRFWVLVCPALFSTWIRSISAYLFVQTQTSKMRGDVM